MLAYAGTDLNPSNIEGNAMSSTNGGIVGVLERARQAEDMDRMMTYTDAFNAYNRAVRYVGGREHWNTEDFIRFARILELIDEVKPEPQKFSPPNAKLHPNRVGMDTEGDNFKEEFSTAINNMRPKTT